MFATFIGAPVSDWILRMAVAPDGSAWPSISSFDTCCVDMKYRLVRFEPTGSRLLADKPLAVGDVAVGRESNLFATSDENFTVSPEALVGSACNSPAYPKGTTRSSKANRQGCSPAASSMGASSSNADAISPGAIVTLFGSQMGLRQGAAFQLENGRIPTSLAAIPVLVNGDSIPLLYASYWQVNAILPYSLPLGTRPAIQVESNSQPGNVLANSYVQRTGLSIFRLDGSPNSPAAALNEDGSVNSSTNPSGQAPHPASSRASLKSTLDSLTPFRRYLVLPGSRAPLHQHLGLVLPWLRHRCRPINETALSTSLDRGRFPSPHSWRISRASRPEMRPRFLTVTTRSTTIFPSTSTTCLNPHFISHFPWWILLPGTDCRPTVFELPSAT